MKYLKLALVAVALAFCPAQSDDLKELKEAAAKILNVKSDDISLKKSRERIKSGAMYLFDIGKKKYVLKKFGNKRSAEDIHREIESCKLVAQAGIGPEFVGSTKDGTIYVRSYINGKITRDVDWTNDENLKALADTVKKLHKINSSTTYKKWIGDRIDKHYQVIKDTGVAVPKGYDEELKAVEKIIEKLKNAEKQVFCHKDLNPGNLVLTPEGKIMLIGIAKAGLGNLYEELGILTTSHNIEGEALDKFLKYYFERTPTEKEKELVQLAQQAARFLVSIIWLRFSESSKEKKEGLAARMKHIDEALQSFTKNPKAIDEAKKKYVSPKNRKKGTVLDYALAHYAEYLAHK
jgi:thiamine kinase-like enzyme